jgi:hypothetical protein
VRSWRCYAQLQDERRWASRPWTGSWTGASDNPSAASAIDAMTCGIVAASVFGACGHTSCKRQASGSNPLTGSQLSDLCTLFAFGCVARFVERMALIRAIVADLLARYFEQSAKALPSSR